MLSIVLFSLFLLSPTQPVIGDKAPTFFLKTLDGEKIFLSDLCGSPDKFKTRPRKDVLLSFWATWCGPCRQELPELHKLVQYHASQDLAAFLINVGESEDSVRTFLKQNPYTLTVLLDPHGNAAGKYCPKDGSLVSLPTVVLIDKEGIIRYIRTGYDEDGLSALRKKLQELQD